MTERALDMPAVEENPPARDNPPVAPAPRRDILALADEDETRTWLAWVGEV
jgi:hypothetical protein